MQRTLIVGCIISDTNNVSDGTLQTQPTRLFQTVEADENKKNWAQRRPIEVRSR